MPLVKCISPHLNVINDNALIPTLPRSQSLPSLLSIEIRTGRWTTHFHPLFSHPMHINNTTGLKDTMISAQKTSQCFIRDILSEDTLQAMTSSVLRWIGPDEVIP